MESVEKDQNPIRRSGASHKGRRWIAAGLLTAAALTGLYFGYRYFFPQKGELPFEVAFPGSAADGLSYETTKYAVDLKKGLEDNLIVSGLAAEYYQIGNLTGTVKPEISEDLLFDDQIELLSFYAEQNDRSAFNRLNEWIQSAFRADSGFYVKRVSASTMKKPDGDLEIRVSDQIRYCRVLIEAYERFDQAANLELAENLSDQIYPLCEQNSFLPPEMSVALPAATLTPDFAATPTPKPTAVPTMDPSQITSIGVVDLSSVDLYAIRLLAALDPKWSAVYDNCLAVIQNAAVDEPVPFYNAGYSTEKSGYVPYLTENAQFVFADQMKIALHLAEVSALRESTFSYLKQLLLNANTYYETYDILTGKPLSEAESIAGYAMMARIARIRGDKDLYDLCIGRIKWNTADSVTSDIFGLPFRTLPDGSIRAYASDAAAALKAVY